MPFTICLISMFTHNDKVLIFAVKVGKGWGVRKMSKFFSKKLEVKFSE